MTKQPFINDINIGFELPALIKQPTPRQLVQYAGASGDFYEIHYDKDFAVAQGLPGVIIHGALKSAWIAQVVTDWMGSDGSLQSFSVRYRAMDVPGDNLTCTATVVEKNEAAGTIRCDIKLANGTGEVTTTGDAVVRLPSR